MYRVQTPCLFSPRHDRWLAKLCGRIALLYALCVFGGASALAQLAHPFASAEYQRNHEKLGRVFGQLFSGITLRESLGRLSGATEVPIWLDRRVDGEQQVNLIAGDATVRQTLDALTEQLNLGWVWIGEVPYVCLAADAPHLQASFWRHAIASKGLLRSRPPIDLRWSQPAEPRILLNEFLSGADLDVEVLDTPEHDLWAPAALQGTRPETAATLLLGGFELELAARGSGLAIEAIGEVDAVAEDGRLSFAWPYPAAAVDKIDASRRKAIETRHAGHFEWRVVGDRAWLKASA